MSSGEGTGKKRRSYRPIVEALEALRLLSALTQPFQGLAVQRDSLPGPVPLAPGAPLPSDAWDAALSQTELADLLGPASSSSSSTIVAPADAQSISSGLEQLNRYLSRTWYRAGVPAQQHEDCSQAVYETLLKNLGRDRFDSLLGDIGQNGIRDVLSRETADGPDFFRAIDTVKKRAQRERSFQPLDSIDVAAGSPSDATKAGWSDALHEAIDSQLTPREAALINATLNGETPAEIAQKWGVAAKTVSNEKTRVLQKLRETLVSDFSN